MDRQLRGAQMKGSYTRWIILLLSGISFVGGRPCMADSACARLAVKTSVRIGSGELTLADLLTPDTCARLRTMAERISLGVAPLPSTVRVVPGSQVRSWLESLAAAIGLNEEVVDRLPARILVRRAGESKPCSEIASLALRSLSAESRAGRAAQRLDCAAAQSVPEAAPLEVTKTFWNASLRRWEISLRCLRTEDCAPFLVWAAAPSTGQNYSSQSAPASLPLPQDSGRRGELIKRGQTATLRWDEAGIRIVLPVICLDAGGTGQTIRVRFKNAAHILRAEILSDGTLWAGL